MLLEEVKDYYSAWCTQVNAQANGDLAKLMTSGFELTKQRAPCPIPEQIDKVSVNAIAQGVAKLNWSGSTNRAYYQVAMLSNGT